ncbi:MAG: hypothetical protein IPK16_30830 [Anaerolineales bacterium]|nr:hypothetical protein [Anaerolineales bacterium]
MLRNVNRAQNRALLHSLLPGLWLALAVLLLAFIPGNAQDPTLQPAAVHGTTIDRNIDQNTTWTKSGSPYNVTRFVAVRPGVTLTVRPGVGGVR